MFRSSRKEPHEPQSRKVLFVGEDQETLLRYRADIGQLGSVEVSYEEGKLSGINGRAMSLAKKHDIIVFQTDGADADVAELKRLKEKTVDRVFVALVDDDISVAKARGLIEAGAAEIMPSPFSGQDPLAMLRGPQEAQPVRAAGRAQGTVFSVAQSRGGAGGTTVAVNLAVSLAQTVHPKLKKGEPNPVALLDFDLQFGNAGVYFDLEDNGGMLDLVSSPMLPPDQDILRAAQTSSFGVDVLTAPAIFAPINAMTAERAQSIVAAFAAHYSYVVIDLPKVVVEWMEPVIANSDRLVMVSDLSVPCVRQAKRLIDFYRETNVTLPVDLVLNRERKTMLKSDAQRDAEKFLNLGVAAWVPDNAEEERRSVDLGTPTASRRSKGRAAFRKLGKVLAKQATQNNTLPTGR